MTPRWACFWPSSRLQGITKNNNLVRGKQTIWNSAWILLLIFIWPSRFLPMFSTAQSLPQNVLFHAATFSQKCKQYDNNEKNNKVWQHAASLFLFSWGNVGTCVHVLWRQRPIRVVAHFNLWPRVLYCVQLILSKCLCNWYNRPFATNKNAKLGIE